MLGPEGEKFRASFKAQPMEFTINVQCTKIPVPRKEEILKVVADALTKRMTAVTLSSLDPGYESEIYRDKTTSIKIKKYSH